MINEAGLALLREYEGCRLFAYLDAGGVATIGYGHTLNVRLGQSCTQDEAEMWLAQDAANAEAGVAAAIKVPITDNERAACATFAFNVGVANFRASSICRLLNAADRAGAARAFLLWDKARVGGQLVSLPGLQRRRAAEAHLFLTPVAMPAQEGAVNEPPSLAVPPEESGISTVEKPPDAVGGKVTAGTAIAVASGVAKEAIDRVQPVHDGLTFLGFSPEWIMAVLALLLLAALAYVGVRHVQARQAGRA